MNAVAWCGELVTVALQESCTLFHSGMQFEPFTLLNRTAEMIRYGSIVISAIEPRHLILTESTRNHETHTRCSCLYQYEGKV